MTDKIIRATAAQEHIRAFAVDSTEMVAEAREIHKTYPVVTATLGRLLSAGAMMGSMMKGDDDLITLTIKGDGPIGSLTVTTDSHGNVGTATRLVIIMDPEAPTLHLDGDETITADEVAGLCGTIGYEIVCGISKRVPRIYEY